MIRTRLNGAVVAAALIIGLPPMAFAQTVIEDDDFALGDWTDSPPFPTPTDAIGATFNSEPVPVDGNPDAFIRLHVAYPPVASGAAAAWGITTYEANDYDPGAAGPIDSIDFSICD